MNRRQFIGTSALLTGSASSVSCRDSDSDSQTAGRTANPSGTWGEVREQFDLSPDIIDLSALFISSHPRPVREAIERHRRSLDENPTVYLEGNIAANRDRTRNAAVAYLGARNSDEIALTDSTTEGIGLVYNGFHLEPGQEFLRSNHNYYSTKEAVRLASRRTGAPVRTVDLYQDSRNTSAGEMVDNLAAAIRPETRVVAVTWVHSSTGVKLPLRQVADRLAEANRGREPNRRVLLCADGVHGLGVEDVELPGLGCDFFMAGCHKWLFGPRGTGIIWAGQDAWQAISPTIPTFTDREVWSASSEGRDPSGPNNGSRMTPGGFKAYEHEWALAEAFDFHRNIGKAEVQRRTHELNRQMKEGLAAMNHVTLYTPMSVDISAGIVCFDVDGMSPRAVVQRLRDRNIVATTTPYSPSYARFTPSIRNTPQEVDAALREVRDMA